jgi:hypothetical protein
MMESQRDTTRTTHHVDAPCAPSMISDYYAPRFLVFFNLTIRDAGDLDGLLPFTVHLEFLNIHPGSAVPRKFLIFNP